MTYMPSRVPELLTALHSLTSTAPDLKALGVRVSNGAQVTDAAAPDWLLIGWDGDPEGEFETARTEGGWSDLAVGREENFEMPCAAISNRGDTDVLAAQARVYEIAGVLGALLKANPSVGLDSLEVAIAATTLQRPQTDQGASARLVITLAGRAFT
jgi:hypothetical protein